MENDEWLLVQVSSVPTTYLLVSLRHTVSILFLVLLNLKLLLLYVVCTAVNLVYQSVEK